MRQLNAQKRPWSDTLLYIMTFSHAETQMNIIVLSYVRLSALQQDKKKTDDAARKWKIHARL